MKTYLILLFALLLSLSSFGKSIIAGKLDPEISRNGKVYLEIHKSYLYDFHSFYATRLSDSVDASGSFRFEIEDPADYYYFDIYYEEEAGGRVVLRNSTNLLLINAGAKVYFETVPKLKNKVFILSGDNTALLRYQEQLLDIWPKSNVKVFRTVADYEQQLLALRDCLRRVDSLSMVYGRSLPGLAKLLALNYASQRIRSLVSSTSRKAFDGSGEVKDSNAVVGLRNLLALMDSYRTQQVDSYFLNHYVDLCYAYEANQLLLEGKYHQDKTGELLLASLKGNYGGHVKEQLLTSFYLRNLTQRHSSIASTDPYAVIGGVKDAELGRVIKEFQRNNTQGTKVYPAILWDTAGNEYHLDQMKGEVLLIEYWFKGCHACRVLSQSLESVLPVYKQRDMIKHITINVDKTFERFLTGVRSGEYTGKNTLNLWIGKEGSYHEMIDKYNYYGFPQLMLVDRDGKLVTPFLSTPTTEQKTQLFFEALDYLLRDQ